MTYDLLRNGDDEMKKRCKASQAKAQTQIVEQVCKTMSTLTGTTVLEEQKRTLSILVEHAVSLSQLLGSQRATYRCFLPQANEQGTLKFENSAMENLMDEQDTDGVAKDVRCVVSPALIKQGGERGEKVSGYHCVIKTS
jgi:type III secretory pathway component EscR